MFDYNITFTHMSVPSTKNVYKITYAKGHLILEPITTPPRKKSKTTFGSPVNDLEEDEEWTCLDEIGSRGGKKLEARTTQGNIEEEPEPNLDKVIDNIQVEPIVSTELVSFITKLVVVATKSFQPIQPKVEPIQIKYPHFF